MNNFKSSGPGGLRGRRDFIGGRPKSDSEYGPKKKFDKKPFGSSRSQGHGGFGGGGRGGDRGGFGGGNRGGERRDVEMHKAICSTCSKSCEVPFRPDGSKPVLCSECFGKSKSDDRGGFEKRDRFSNDRPQRNNDYKFETPHRDHDRTSNANNRALEQQVKSLENKINEILSILKDASAGKPENEVLVAPVEVTVAATSPTKKKTTKKVTEKKVVKKVVKKAVKKVAKKK
ncbi:hypothetical protein GW937_00525 [Candidatus Kaiserbacteria bacterium]|nr:hypothetical protein [Candidatus Kaiserbacteria bacterium]